MKRFISIVCASAIGGGLFAAQGFQLSVVPDFAIVPRGDQVKGVALNIWGENEVDGIDLGLVNGLKRESSGFSLGLVCNYAESYTGVMWGLINIGSDDIVGWNAGVLNISNGYFVGFQSGLLNISQNFKGLQLGVLNYTSSLSGVQLGLVNITADNGWFTEMPGNLAVAFPVVNWSF